MYVASILQIRVRSLKLKKRLPFFKFFDSKFFKRQPVIIFCNVQLTQRPLAFIEHTQSSLGGCLAQFARDGVDVNAVIRTWTREIHSNLNQSTGNFSKKKGR